MKILILIISLFFLFSCTTQSRLIVKSSIDTVKTVVILEAVKKEILTKIDLKKVLQDINVTIEDSAQVIISTPKVFTRKYRVSKIVKSADGKRQEKIEQFYTLKSDSGMITIDLDSIKSIREEQTIIKTESKEETIYRVSWAQKKYYIIIGVTISLLIVIGNLYIKR